MKAELVLSSFTTKRESPNDVTITEIGSVVNLTLTKGDFMRTKLTGVILGVAIFAFCRIGAAADDGFVASKGSDKYHVTTCSVAKQIKPEKRIHFNSESEAVKAGYTPCKLCIKRNAKKIAFVASKDSDKYHLPTCKMAAKINSNKQVTFASQEEAEKAGYKPCQICLPSAPAANDMKKKSKK